MQSVHQTTEPDSDLENSSVSSAILQFPTLPVHGTPADWLSLSQPVQMASVVDDSSADEALSSLGDSSYEFVDDRSIVSSDDEEEQGFMSQSVSSVGLEQETQAPFQTSNEDAHRNEATGSDTRENSDVQHQSRPPSSMSVKSHDKENEDATPWTSTAILDSKQPIALTPSSAGSSEASYTLATFEKPHLPEAVPRNAVDIVRAELKLSMLSDTLILKRPFRLLYVGSPVGKEAIVQKLASTLAMSVKNEDTASSIKQPSKINIFPISEFGAGESPEVVMIDSMGVEMNIEECRSASFIKGHEGSDRLSMTLYDGKVVEGSVSGPSDRVSMRFYDGKVVEDSVLGEKW